MTTLLFEPQPVPLRTDDHGVVRIANTRVSLETVIGAFRDGASAEEIAENYDVLDLADVYAVIGYYLKNRKQVNQYLDEAERDAAEVWREWESSWPDRAEYRERLLARATAMGLIDAATPK